MHDFTGFGGVTGLKFRAGETGGGVNLHINGMGRLGYRLARLDGAMLGGVAVSITMGGSEYECTEVSLNGLVFSLGIGGEEHAHDCIEWDDFDGGGGHGDADCPSYDDMTPMPIAQYFVTDTFTTDAILCEVRPQRFTDGSEYTAGSAFAQASMLACGKRPGARDQRLRSRPPLRRLDRFDDRRQGHRGRPRRSAELRDQRRLPDARPVRRPQRPSWWVASWSTSSSGGGLNECTELFLEGTIDNLVLGGGQHFVDCLEGEVDPNGGGNDQNPDLDHDGDIDGADLAILLGGWGTDAGDLDDDDDTGRCRSRDPARRLDRQLIVTATRPSGR